MLFIIPVGLISSCFRSAARDRQTYYVPVQQAGCQQVQVRQIQTQGCQQIQVRHVQTHGRVVAAPQTVGAYQPAYYVQPQVQPCQPVYYAQPQVQPRQAFVPQSQESECGRPSRRMPWQSRSKNGYTYLRNSQ